MATAPPSQFAALLRQSKFASFDPKIGQVYASYGGYAHRGNWGLKRPLPLRRRKATVTVKAVDSREQQTEWKSAEPQHRWIRMWDEVGITPEEAPKGPWLAKLGPLAQVQWDTDSEFGLATREVTQRKAVAREAAAASGEDGTQEGENPGVTKKGPTQKSYAVPNVEAMSEKEFGRYLEQLRKLRPEFRDYLRRKHSATNKDEQAPEVSLWQESFTAADHHKDFIAEHAHDKYYGEGARVIEQRPQRHGGLTYAQGSSLQTYILTKPQPGRLLQQQSPRSSHRGSRPSEDFVASFAGMTARISKHQRGSEEPINWKALASSDPFAGEENGAASLRLLNVEIYSAPATVAESPGGLESVRINTSVRVDEGAQTQHLRSNPHPPGSREYVSNREADILVASHMLEQPTKRDKDASFTIESPAHLIDTLGVILTNEDRS